jgi:hypothetical protein
LTLRKTTFNSDLRLRASAPTGFVRPIMPSYTNQHLQTTTNTDNIDPLCTVTTASPIFKSRTGHTITPTNAPRPKQTP